jgi:ABC-type multidrug transport system ATPase subunit
MSNAIDLKNVTIVSPQGEVILSDVTASIPPGGVTLFMGGSGAGKSVLMKVIAGLISHKKDGWEVHGEITILGEPVSQGMSLCSYIFQDFALFEDLSLDQNLAIARDHTPNSTSPEEVTYLREQIDQVLLKDVPRNTPVTFLSGGQKQRVAIARALVYNPDILIFDEPNAGLDAGSSRALAALIKNVQEKFNKTVLIILHHTRNFTDIADIFFIIDPSSRSLKLIERIYDDHDLEEQIQSRKSAPELKKKKRFIESLNEAAEKTGETVMSFFSSVVTNLLFPWFKVPSWGFRYLWEYQKLVGIFSLSNIFYMIISGIIVGFVATYFVFELLPYRNIMEPLLGDQLLRAVGYILYRIAIPVIASILIAAKGGAVIAADISTRQYNRQLDAMQTLGIPYRRYLLTGILISFVVHTPLLTSIISFEASRFTTLMVYKWIKPESSYYVWKEWFHYSLGVFPFYRGMGYVWAKTALSGLMVGFIAWQYGSSEKKSIDDVNASITGTIVSGTVAVLLVHFIFAFIEFNR